MEDNIKEALQEDMTSACLASQFRTELGPAQPQLVLNLLLSHYSTCIQQKIIIGSDLKEISHKISHKILTNIGGSRTKVTPDKGLSAGKCFDCFQI